MWKIKKKKVAYLDIIKREFEDVALIGFLAWLRRVRYHFGNLEDGVVDHVATATFDMVMVFPSSLNAFNRRLGVEVISG